MVRIGHASIDERGKVSGGKAGDQSGREVCVRSWYNAGWGYVLRPLDAATGDCIATAMARAADNPKIGYDQGQRNSLLKLVRSRGYDPGQATTACECDCSSLVALCCMYAGIPEHLLVIDGNSVTTSTIRARLMRSGRFETLSGERYCGSPFLLRRGDILLREGHHVAVVLSNGAGVQSSASRILRQGCRGEDVKTLQRALNEQSGAMLNVDGEYGPLTAAAVRCWQSTHALEVDGEAGPVTLGSLGL